MGISLPVPVLLKLVSPKIVKHFKHLTLKHRLGNCVGAS
jgi:hypothetical protein